MLSSFTVAFGTSSSVFKKTANQWIDSRHIFPSLTLIVLVLLPGFDRNHQSSSRIFRSRYTSIVFINILREVVRMIRLKPIFSSLLTPYPFARESTAVLSMLEIERAAALFTSTHILSNLCPVITEFMQGLGERIDFVLGPFYQREPTEKCMVPIEAVRLPSSCVKFGFSGMVDGILDASSSSSSSSMGCVDVCR